MWCLGCLTFSKVFGLHPCPFLVSCSILLVFDLLHSSVVCLAKASFLFRFPILPPGPFQIHSASLSVISGRSHLRWFVSSTVSSTFFYQYCNRIWINPVSLSLLPYFKTNTIREKHTFSVNYRSYWSIAQLLKMYYLITFYMLDTVLGSKQENTHKELLEYLISKANREEKRKKKTRKMMTEWKMALFWGAVLLLLHQMSKVDVSVCRQCGVMKRAHTWNQTKFQTGRRILQEIGRKDHDHDVRRRRFESGRWLKLRTDGRVWQQTGSNQSFN